MCGRYCWLVPSGCTLRYSQRFSVIDTVASRSLGYFWHRITAKTSWRVDAAVSRVLSSKTVIRPVSLISLREKQREREAEAGSASSHVVKRLIN